MLIFLDIDGVLHPDPATADQAFCRSHLLCELLKARPVVDVVISSDWRLHHSLDELVAFILANSNDQLSHRFVGVTPTLPWAKHEYRGRECECLQWLAASNVPNRAWLSIDDVAGNFTHGSPNLLLTDYRVGLTASNINYLLSKIPT